MAFTLVLSNDPDHGLLHNDKKAFSALNKIGVKITHSVFCKLEDDKSPLAKHCNVKETSSLSDPRYVDFLLKMRERGNEIAFHGYSQISNSRESFLNGLEIYKSIFDEYPYTYIEHGGILGRHADGMVKKESLSYKGSDENSKYYIKDIVESIFKCVWERKDGLFDEGNADWDVKKVNDVLSFKNGVGRIRRHRMKNLDHKSYLDAITENDGIFMGYTHFGYRGLESRINKSFLNIPTFMKDVYLDCYHGNYRSQRAAKIIDEINNQYGFESMTIKDFVKKNKT
jgi:hypothetical protein